MKFATRVLVAVWGLGFCGSWASAAPIPFTVSGVLSNGSSLTGTLTIDPVLGLATAVELTFGPPTSQTFTLIETQAQTDPMVYYIRAGVASEFPDFNILLPVASLIGYTGSVICSGADFFACGGPSSHVFGPTEIIGLASGSVVSAVPEPASLLLLSTGLAGAALRRRLSGRSCNGGRITSTRVPRD